jgi:hypothetical protein
VLVERERWTPNIARFTVITWVYENLLQLYSGTVEFSSGTTQNAVTVPGAIGRPTDDTGFGGTEQAHVEFAPARRLCIGWAPRRRRCGQVGDAEMSLLTSSGHTQVGVCNCVSEQASMYLVSGQPLSGCNPANPFRQMETLDLIIDIFFFTSCRLDRSLACTLAWHGHSRSAEADFSTERVPRAATAVRSVASK